MSQLSLLNAEQHHDLRIAQTHSAICASKMQVIPIEASEVPNISCQMPIFFTQSGSPTQLALSALSSLFEAYPLFVNNNSWLATHMPLSLKTAPFQLVPSPQDPEQLAVAMDPNHAAFCASGALLYQDGQPTSTLNVITENLQSKLASSFQTHQFLEEFKSQGLLKSINIVLHKADSTQLTLQGLFTIDEDKLRNIATPLLSKWHQNGYLMILHAVLLSMQQLNPLISRHNDTYPENKVIKLQMQLGELAS